ncbi:hypothetical protein ABFS82_02G130100 [Erythranthe guttata]|uniref:DM2 domain-containing protein n=1 Tax=Erythranthe guttata TaxID=4155 RepID=A0A022QHV3_ERYGU|nr:PREDICTED: upstream activation factor subunit spp27 [Erythranthe guttata]EYU27179.1 hypothetical protein MIMGU_mgv1a016089mg [Erythranthe guttata]|eukprot:XP_012849683.1 PREDICTED: upstream activation factor subunit spp27 [Erythranthe guttata]
MSTPSGFLRGTRALFAAAAKSAAPLPKTNVASTSSKKPAAAAKPSKEKKASTSGIMKPTPISPTLQSLVGAPEISRVGAVKKIWEYIKLHNLQNPSDKREIICDDKLKKLFNGQDKVGFLQIAKLLSPHFIKTV